MLRTTPSPAFLSLLALPLHSQGLDFSLALIMAILERELTGEKRLVAVCKLLRRGQGAFDAIFIPIMGVANKSTHSWLS
ncbi:hypothetical protein K443DRAFT_681312 [Laccaria amethystina LaAM-08-1]|jgi:hypothetical protein|uniref:Secreted protein n=1 Tax=Laccaria amethystina LaAM-08-1 TaxID=1095629 RepID=A0A0C9WY61_9AGAR|nr:hypothetical protein K443DRAFT_681312 [Laccaria amethystina LaAM-08-1]